MAVHAHYRSLYISLPSFANQERDMTTQSSPTRRENLGDEGPMLEAFYIVQSCFLVPIALFSSHAKAPLTKR